MEAESLEEDPKAAPSPAVKEDNGKAELDEMDLVADEHRRFRSEGSDVELPGPGQERHPVCCEGDLSGNVEGMVAKVHERRAVDRRRCRSKALEQDPEGQSTEFLERQSPTRW